MQCTCFEKKKKIERESKTTPQHAQPPPLPPLSFVFIILSVKVSSKSYIREAKVFQNESSFFLCFL